MVVSGRNGSGILLIFFRLSSSKSWVSGISNDRLSHEVYLTICPFALSESASMESTIATLMSLRHVVSAVQATSNEMVSSAKAIWSGRKRFKVV